MPVNNATYMGQCWVVIHHKRGDPFTLILSIRFNTIQIFTVSNALYIADSTHKEQVNIYDIKDDNCFVLSS